MKYVNGDGTHRKKQIHKLNICSKGMTPITKNIFVVDEQGNQYEATYPKRAKGLVKNGRARFIDEQTICLACPPHIKTEDNIMSEYKETAHNTIAEPATPTKYTIEYILEQLEKIADTSYLNEVNRLISDSTEGKLFRDSQVLLLGKMIESREQTNQKLIALYEEMYRDLQSANAKEKLVADF